MKEMEPLETWKNPNEFIKYQRLQQQKKKQLLAARLNNATNNQRQQQITADEKTCLLERKVAQKRKNPFAKSSENVKKSKHFEEIGINERFDSVIKPTVQLVDTDENTANTTKDSDSSPPQQSSSKLVLQPFDKNTFSQLFQKSAASKESGINEDAVNLKEQTFSKHLPMDWSIKTRIRFFCQNELPTTTLKTNQMASSLTSFVRCIDSQNACSGLDISPATRFSQATYYWQHPHIPWLTLFPRNSKENNGFTLGEKERKALAEDWDHSFRGLFNLLRARQCPYFYLCANTFTVLFRAAGIAGHVETHALMSPSTRGLRTALRQEGIEYSMPLKKDFLNKSVDGSFNDETNSAESKEPLDFGVENDDSVDVADEQEEDEWLEELGVDQKEIRRIQTDHRRKLNAKEMADDFSDNSLLLIEGVECQGLFSFLLNAKSTISNIGRLAGVPPTLIAPIAFPKATMQNMSLRSNKVRLDGIDYHSIEVKGLILPTFLPYICNLLGEDKNTFSATMGISNVTLAFSKATQILLKSLRQNSVGDKDENKQSSERQLQKTTTGENEKANQVFGQENLSDCGLPATLIEYLCRTDSISVALLERICYDKNHGYAWS